MTLQQIIDENSSESSKILDAKVSLKSIPDMELIEELKTRGYEVKKVYLIDNE